MPSATSGSTSLGGIAITFVLNLGVSFSIASLVALRAYNVGHSERLSILKPTFSGKQLVRSPWRFLFPVDPDPPASSRREQHQ